VHLIFIKRPLPQQTKSLCQPLQLLIVVGRAELWLTAILVPPAPQNGEKNPRICAIIKQDPGKINAKNNFQNLARLLNWIPHEQTVAAP
jgi:hypothetical protein